MLFFETDFSNFSKIIHQNDRISRFPMSIPILFIFGRNLFLFRFEILSIVNFIGFGAAHTKN